MLAFPHRVTRGQAIDALRAHTGANIVVHWSELSVDGVGYAPNDPLGLSELSLPPGRAIGAIFPTLLPRPRGVRGLFQCFVTCDPVGGILHVSASGRSVPTALRVYDVTLRAISFEWPNDSPAPSARASAASAAQGAVDAILTRLGERAFFPRTGLFAGRLIVHATPDAHSLIRITLGERPLDPPPERGRAHPPTFDP